jgi:hypothetical protein
MFEHDRLIQESQATKDAQTLATVYIRQGSEEFRRQHDVLMRDKKIKDFEHAILIERVRTILINNGTIIKRRQP